MGGCCGRNFTDEEIDKSKSLKELAEIFQKRKDTFPTEGNQIKAYLEDPNTEVENIDVKGIEPSILEKRIDYLKDLEGAYTKVAETLESNPNLPLDEAKSHCTDIVSRYFQTYDPNKELDSDMEKFEEFVEKYQNKE